VRGPAAGAKKRFRQADLPHGLAPRACAAAAWRPRRPRRTRQRLRMPSARPPRLCADASPRPSHRHRQVCVAGRVCRSWRVFAIEVLLRDTAISRPKRCAGRPVVVPAQSVRSPLALQACCRAARQARSRRHLDAGHTGACRARRAAPLFCVARLTCGACRLRACATSTLPRAAASAAATRSRASRSATRASASKPSRRRRPPCRGCSCATAPRPSRALRVRWTPPTSPARAARSRRCWRPRPATPLRPSAA
jgi:hypothetical protein